MQKLFVFISLLIACNLPALSITDMYKQVDKNGHVTYSNVKIKGSTKIDLGPVGNSFGSNTKNALKPTSRTPSHFPSVDNNTQKQRDQSRKAILLSELAAERAALADAKKAYAQSEANPEVSRLRNTNGATSSLRKTPQSLEKLKQLKMNVAVHQRNIMLLAQEISMIN
jgi:hypothetical protein